MSVALAFMWFCLFSVLIRHQCCMGCTVTEDQLLYCIVSFILEWVLTSWYCCWLFNGNIRVVQLRMAQSSSSLVIRFVCTGCAAANEMMQKAFKVLQVYCVSSCQLLDMCLRLFLRKKEKCRTQTIVGLVWWLVCKEDAVYISIKHCTSMKVGLMQRDAWGGCVLKEDMKKFWFVQNRCADQEQGGDRN